MEKYNEWNQKEWIRKIYSMPNCAEMNNKYYILEAPKLHMIGTYQNFHQIGKVAYLKFQTTWLTNKTP